MNAVPDTFGLDFRPVDIVENTHFYSVNFRSTTLLYYKNARAGQRHFKIFLANPSLTAPSAEQQGSNPEAVCSQDEVMMQGLQDPKNLDINELLDFIKSPRGPTPRGGNTVGAMGYLGKPRGQAGTPAGSGSGG